MQITKDNEFDVINFTNTTAESFTGKWGGVEEVIGAGETKPLPRFKAAHYANQLAKKILLGQVGQPFGDENLREDLTAKMLGQVAVPEVKQEVATAPEEPEFVEAPREEPVEASATAPAEEEPVEEPKPKRGKRKSTK